MLPFLAFYHYESRHKIILTVNGHRGLPMLSSQGECQILTGITLFIPYEFNASIAYFMADMGSEYGEKHNS